MPGTAVFLDRDDTIIRDRNYLRDPAGIEILPGAADAIRLLNVAGLPAIIITNQSGIARGLFDEDRLRLIHARLLELLAGQGAKIDAIYYCPHHPDGIIERYAISCRCRKPDTGMLMQAANDFGLDLASCFMIGDKPDDMELIHNVGGKGIFMQTGKHRSGPSKPDFATDSLVRAVQWILCTKEKRTS